MIWLLVRAAGTPTPRTEALDLDGGLRRVVAQGKVWSFCVNGSRVLWPTSAGLLMEDATGGLAVRVLAGQDFSDDSPVSSGSAIAWMDGSNAVTIETGGLAQ